MPKDSYPLTQVTVALIMDRQLRTLWTYNSKWGAFALPMTKRREGEVSADAAARAGAEVLGVPVSVGEMWTAVPELALSGRDGVARCYAYDVFRVEPVSTFAAALQRPDLLWLNIEQVFADDWRPRLSATALDLVRRLIEVGRLPGRSQLTSVVILKRQQGGQEQVLLRWDPDWGFALPTKQREEREPVRDAAERAVRQELQLEPGRDVILKPAGIPTFTTRGASGSTGLPTFYVHTLFYGALNAAAKEPSSEADLPLVWVSLSEIAAGQIGTPPAGARPGNAGPGQVSLTVQQILGALGAMPWSIP
jgi:ADP-ribose pyrophosphatase YjhB (NUDIX family)